MKRSHVLAVATLAVLPLTAHADFMDIGKSAQQSSARSGGGGGGNPSLGAGLSDGRIGSGLEEALRVGTQKAVATVDHPGGFLNDRNVHIPLPGPLERVRSGLALVGASSRAEISTSASIAPRKSRRRRRRGSSARPPAI